MEPSASSIVIESCISSEASPPTGIIQLLEISLISAEDLTPVSKSMQTYVVAWVNPNRKRTTQTDPHGHTNPEWTEKLIFRLDNNDLEDAKLTVEIYAISWFRDFLVGTVCVSITELIAPLLQTTPNCTKTTRFVALQVRRPSGAPQGKLNMGVGLLDSTMRSVPPINFSGENLRQQSNVRYDEYDDDDKLKEKIHLWRSMSTGSSDIKNEGLTSKRGSVDNGSRVSGSMWEIGSDICSELGPSASMVAEEMARKMLPPSGKVAEVDDAASSILEVMTFEEATAKGYRVASKERLQKAASEDDGGSELSVSSRRSRRKSDGGLFSCIAYGIEFSIVCGASKKPGGNGRNGSKRRGKTSEVNSA